MERQELKDYLILLEEREKFLVEQLCGSKYTRGSFEYKRYKTRRKIILTKFGKVDRHFVYVKHTLTGDIVSPLLVWLGIPKYQRLSVNFKQVLARKASRGTYQKGVEDIEDGFGFSIVRQTLHRYVKDTCSDLQIEQPPNPSHEVLLADGTKVKSGSDEKHEVRTIISLGNATSEKALLREEINKSWSELAEGMDFSQYRVFVGDGEPGLKEALCKEHMEFQYCHEHAKRDLAFFLWKDGLNKKKYIQYTQKFEEILHCLQNSTKKHAADKDWQRLILRIQWAKKEINTLAMKINCRNLWEASSFLRRNKDYFTTAAEMAIIGVQVPWTTNSIERVMQEIGIRTKKKGMHWSENGLHRILKMVLKRYFLPTNQRTYKEIFTSTQKEAVKS